MSDRPLADRVEWSGAAPTNCTCWTCDVGEWHVWLFHHAGQKEWLAQAATGGRVAYVFDFDAPNVPAAKLEALRLVQAAVLAAADAWRGPITREVGGD